MTGVVTKSDNDRLSRTLKDTEEEMNLTIQTYQNTIAEMEAKGPASAMDSEKERQLNSDLARAKVEKQLFEKEIARLKGDNLKHRTISEKLGKSLDELQKNLDRRVDEAKAVQLQTLRKDIDDSKKKLKQAEDDNETLLAQRNALTRQKDLMLKECKQEVEKRDTQMAKLRETADKATSDLAKQLEQAKEADKLKTRVAELEKAVVDTSKLKESQTENETLKTQMQKLQAEAKSYKETQDDNMRKIVGLREEIDQLQRDLEEKAAIPTISPEELQKEKKKSERFEKDLEKVKRELAEREAIPTISPEELKREKSKTERLEKELAGIKEETEQLRRRVKEVESVPKISPEELVGEKMKSEKLEKRVAALQDELDQAKRKLEENSKAASAGNPSEELKNEKERNEELERKTSELRELIDSKDEELLKVKGELRIAMMKLGAASPS